MLEQQVSLASARAAFDRLVAATDPLTPERFLRLTDAQLLAIGFSRQKARYGRALATALVDGALDLDALTALDDEAVQRILEAIPGIGRWSSTIYLLMVLGRPDVWPVGDMALATAVGEATGLPARPGPDELARIGEAWRPWRSVAARLFWHDYLGRRRTTIARHARAKCRCDPSSGCVVVRFAVRCVGWSGHHESRHHEEETDPPDRSVQPPDGRRRRPGAALHAHHRDRLRVVRAPRQRVGRWRPRPGADGRSRRAGDRSGRPQRERLAGHLSRTERVGSGGPGHRARDAAGARSRAPGGRPGCGRPDHTTRARRRHATPAGRTDGRPHPSTGARLPTRPRGRRSRRRRGRDRRRTRPRDRHQTRPRARRPTRRRRRQPTPVPDECLDLPILPPVCL